MASPRPYFTTVLATPDRIEKCLCVELWECRRRFRGLWLRQPHVDTVTALCLHAFDRAMRPGMRLCTTAQTRFVPGGCPLCSFGLFTEPQSTAGLAALTQTVTRPFRVRRARGARGWSEHPELQFRGVRHPVSASRWVPDDVHVSVGDAG